MTGNEAYIKLLWHHGAVLLQDEPFTLKSGRQSFIYANHRDLICLPSAAQIMIDALTDLLDTEFKTKELAVATTNSSVSPLLGAMCVAKGYPLYLTRPVSHERGLTSNFFSYDALSDDLLPRDLPAVIVDDVITTTSTVGATAETLRSRGREVLGVVCLLDRRVTKDLTKETWPIYAVATLEEVISFALHSQLLDENKKILAEDELLEVRRAE